jgi:hypothetical protein
MTDRQAPEIRFFNRELSWLEFNQRVLDEARDESLPALERLKFLAITASNLDEFFMVRVGGLQVLVDRGISQTDRPARLLPSNLRQSASGPMRWWPSSRPALRELEPKLAEGGIRRMRGAELTDRQARVVEQVFESEIFPVMTPRAVELRRGVSAAGQPDAARRRAACARCDERGPAAICDHSAGPLAAAVFHAGHRRAGLFVSCSFLARGAGPRRLSHHAQRRPHAARRSGDRPAGGHGGVLTPASRATACGWRSRPMPAPKTCWRR